VVFTRLVLFFNLEQGYPRSTAAAVATKNNPPDCFLNVATDSQRDNQFFQRVFKNPETITVFGVLLLPCFLLWCKLFKTPYDNKKS